MKCRRAEITDGRDGIGGNRDELRGTYVGGWRGYSQGSSADAGKAVQFAQCEISCHLGVIDDDPSVAEDGAVEHK